MTYQEHFDKSCELRKEFWSTIGTVDADVLAPLINPSFTGGPTWPSLRQAFRTIRRPEVTIIASDGLSDPYDNLNEDQPNADYNNLNGFGLEVYVETEPITGSVQGTWQFDLAYQAAQLMAGQGNVISLLEEMTYITSEFFNVSVPPEFLTANNTVGIILGLPNAKFSDTVQLSAEPVKMVNVKLLTLAELNYIIENGDEGRNKLAELLIAQGNATLSTLERPSVI
jgi:hypothetical protein